jgi:hypothetical protein
VIIGLIPLDERPVNTWQPTLLGEIAGAQVIIPPPQALSQFRTPANPDVLSGWLIENAGKFDALIVSCEMLGYGGLIASRISHEPLSTITARLDVLRTIKRQRPDLPILGFNVITRISRHNDNTEEPDYWAEYGNRLFRLSQWMDRAGRGAMVEAELQAARALIPAPLIDDFVQRRARNHQVNRTVLGLLAKGVFDLLVLSSDDTSPYGLGSQEKRALKSEAERLAVGERLLMYPGADEVGCVLIARLLNQAAGQTPRFRPVYTFPGGEQITAAFEDGPIAETVERQIRAAGAVLVHEPGAEDIVLVVNPPLNTEADFPRDYTPAEYAERHLHLVQTLSALSATNQRIAVADVAHSNGADRLFFDLLRQRFDLTRLEAYGAWNTAGNTLGTVIAQACLSLLARDQQQQHAQQYFLAHRLIEDWAYQSIVRQEVRNWLHDQSGHYEPTADQLSATERWIEVRLNHWLAELPQFNGWRIHAGSVSLPWKRTFEVNFTLEKS